MPKVSDSATDAAPAPTKMLAPALVLTLVAIAGGAVLGAMLPLSSASAPDVAHASKEAPVEDAPHGAAPHGHNPTDAGAKEHDASPAAEELQLRELAPIVTNLGEPESSWVRLQASIVYDAKALQHPDVVVAEIMSDTVAYMRTLSLSSIQGAEGLRLLHEELSDRAAARSEGAVREFIIQTFVVQ